MVYGYARCSTNESKQDITRQIKQLQAAGAKEVITEWEHGDAKTKKQLQGLLETAQAGDSIITVDCREGSIDPMSQAFIQMSAVFSELELSIIRARVKSGMANAKAKGRPIGRRPTTKEDIPAVFWKHYAAFREGRLNVSELARVCGVSRPTVYKYLRMVR